MKGVEAVVLASTVGLTEWVSHCSLSVETLAHLTLSDSFFCFLCGSWVRGGYSVRILAISTLMVARFVMMTYPFTSLVRVFFWLHHTGSLVLKRITGSLHLEILLDSLFVVFLRVESRPGQLSIQNHCHVLISICHEAFPATLSRHLEKCLLKELLQALAKCRMIMLMFSLFFIHRVMFLLAKDIIKRE